MKKINPNPSYNTSDEHEQFLKTDNNLNAKTLKKVKYLKELSTKLCENYQYDKNISFLD